MNLSRATFDNLRGAVLDGADLAGADLTNVDLTGTVLSFVYNVFCSNVNLHVFYFVLLFVKVQNSKVL